MKNILTFFYEAAASVAVALLVWGVGVVGIEFVTWEGNASAASGTNRIYLLLAAPCFLGIMSFFLVKSSHGYKGPSDLIAVLKQKSTQFPGWIRATITWVIACIELGSGLSPKGFEGPYVATAGGLSGWLATKLSLDSASRKRLARCGVGAAFGVLFRAPLGGFICIFEFGGFERTEFRKQLIPAIISTLVSFELTSIMGLPTPFKAVSLPSLITTYRLFLLFIVGVACGIAGSCYVLAIRISKRVFERLERHIPLVCIPVMGATVSTVLGGIFPIILGSNELSRVFSQSPTLPLLLCGAILAKIVATAAADGSKCAGGTVGPAILLGGLIGTLVGGLDPIFAAAGAASVIGPIAGLPFAMLLTVITWLGYTPVAWLIIMPMVLSKAVCWGLELYPYPASHLLMFNWWIRRIVRYFPQSRPRLDEIEMDPLS
jgi:H+/Cl- antiporter ClcA